jgi:hypothetical protein
MRRVKITGAPGSVNPLPKAPNVALPCTWQDCETIVLRKLGRKRCELHKRSRREQSADFPEWRLGFSDSTGYAYLSRTVNGRTERVAAHRMIMEHKIGRTLLSGENVHHINGVKNDNRPENLELWSTSQPYGQRVIDKVAWAHTILDLYEN